MVNEGILRIDTPSAKHLEFTSDRFYPASYLWRIGNTIIISFIFAKQKGMFCQLINSIVENGFDFEIPTPSSRMREIGKKQGWHSYQKYSDEFCADVDILTNRAVENK
jgi:hypothetical protein